MSDKQLTGFQKLCKMYGEVKFDGVVWVWDYRTDEAKLQSEMSKEDFALSEKAKWTKLRNYLNETTIQNH